MAINSLSAMPAQSSSLVYLAISTAFSTVSFSAAGLKSAVDALPFFCPTNTAIPSPPSFVNSTVSTSFMREETAMPCTFDMLASAAVAPF